MNPPESIQRRDFIRQLGLASTAALGSTGTSLWGEEGISHPEARADTCILIWMAGGMAGLIPGTPENPGKNLTI